jgi:hypothetical protein
LFLVSILNNLIVNDKKLQIDQNWTILDMFKDLKLTFKKEELSTYYTNMNIYFDIAPENTNTIEPLSTNKQKEIIIIKKKENEEEIFTQEFDEKKYFLKFYYENIVNNKALYSVKRAAPFIYLISLLELCVNDFGELFNLKITFNNNLENSKVSSLLHKQMKDPYAVTSNNIPNWCKELCQSFPFLASFPSRHLLFKITSFDMKRSFTNLYSYLKKVMGEKKIDDSMLLSHKRKRSKIDRDNFLCSAEKMMKDTIGYIVNLILN